MMTSRPAAVAGSFYPAQAFELKALLHRYLDGVQETSEAPKAMIVPHAGYIYSGPVAATAYARLKPVRKQIKRVILLGPVHRIAVNGLATVSVGKFTTPLGNIPIDIDAIQKVSSLPQVITSDEAHAQEHSLEVHLPFLQTCLQDFQLVPFVVGDTTAHEVAELLETLWGGKETLIVISSDLSHFLDYEAAQQRDRITSEHINRLEYERLSHQDACGRNPISGLLHLARKRGYGIETIDLRNSGDTAGNKHRVVGYGSYILTPPIISSRYTWGEGQQLIEIAHQSILHGLKHGQPLPIEANKYPKHLRHKRATFITLNKQGQLRGCIGSLEARRSLADDINENAYAAAFQDTRFPALSGKELDELDINISILTSTRPIYFSSETDLLRQLRPGVDGLILEDAGQHSTFLPSVWKSLPKKEAFWRELKRKAALPYGHWSKTIKVYRYETQSFP